ncbi:hypothetical protein HDF18_13200 [Mucilaginibacter sp. X5P1]|uniref:hypothetical protein n=1 Tax=Mucilaginibacter sp. X5P1 TaxID=2723088 RepID=UPI00161F3568|nr:hypothetical protein [Mucilaginibacter sp. X5P1]MBB6141702.1 hypothetical protein [Mucilaginibacter sp. X5P1]
MNRTDDLTGSLVLVHPDLQDDPAKKQNQIGIITHADIENDNVIVSFGKGEQALYSTDALLTLKSANDIYRDLLNNNKDLDKSDFKALFQISLLQEYGTSGQNKSAIELAMKNDTLRNYSMVTLEDSLKANLSQSIER